MSKTNLDFNTQEYPYLRGVMPFTNSPEHFKKRDFIFEQISAKVKDKQFTLFDLKQFLIDHDPAYRCLDKLDPLMEQA